MNGKARTDARKAYLAAKRQFNMDAAYEVVERCISKDAMDTIVSQVLGGGMNARLILPHPSFDDEDGGGQVSRGSTPTNAIPFAYAGYLKSQTGCPVDEEIVQVCRVGRTKLTRWARFLYQPSFGGAVRSDHPYILVDDVVSTAGTLAALRSFIRRNGGRVMFATVLANSSGKNQQFPITLPTLRVLAEATEGGFEPFWRETVGHSQECLTEFEGRFLGEWCDEQRKEGAAVGDDLLQRLRARIDEAATTCG